MLTVYGLCGSQPVRAVVWACLIKDLPFEYCDVGLDHPGEDGPLSSMNPTGQIPVIKDGDFTLFEMPAILKYLSRKNGWTDLYPEDVEVRAKIDEYLHFHQNRTRNITHRLMVSHIAVAYPEGLLSGRDLGGMVSGTDVMEGSRNPDKLKLGQEATSKILRFIEQAYFQQTDYLCTDQPSIADIACYQEVGQLVWANLFDFEPFPKVKRWLELMQSVPHHDTAHRYNSELGDIAAEPNTLERMIPALTAGAEAIAAAGIKVVTLD